MENYYQQLLKPEWKRKRKLILERDKYTCQNCNNEFEIKLHSGLAFCPNINNNSLFHYFSLINFDKEYLDITLSNFKISNETLLNNLPGLPNFIWVEYEESVDSCFPKIYSIRRITNEIFKKHFISIFKQQQTINDVSEIVDNLSSFDDNIYFSTETISKNKFFSLELVKLSKSFPIAYYFHLNVHHKVYIEKKLAWEYPDHYLTTLCWECHENIHKGIKIPWLNEYGISKGDLTPCYRCHSAGFFPEYFHVEKGICFRCRGKRFEKFNNK